VPSYGNSGYPRGGLAVTQIFSQERNREEEIFEIKIKDVKIKKGCLIERGDDSDK